MKLEDLKYKGPEGISPAPLDLDLDTTAHTATIGNGVSGMWILQGKRVEIHTADGKVYRIDNIINRIEQLEQEVQSLRNKQAIYGGS